MAISTPAHYSKVVLFLSLFAVSCSTGNKPEEHFTIDGSAANCISEKGLLALQGQASSFEMNLFCIIDSLCLPKDYYDPLSQFDSTIVIHAYLNPRLIKASVSGLGHLALDGGALGKEYFLIQQEYASGGSLEMAMQHMATLCNAAFEDSKVKTNWFRRFFQNGSIVELDAIMNAVMYFLSPREGVMGAILKPIYILGYWCIKMTGSTSKGLLLMTTLFAFIILLLFFWGYGRIGNNKSPVFPLVLADVLLWVMFVFISYYSYRIGKPFQENVFALKAVYHFDNLCPLQTAYSVFVFHPTTLLLVLLASLAFYAAKYLHFDAGLKLAELDGTEDQYVEQVGKNLADSFSNDAIGPFKNFLLVCALFLFIDKSLVIGFLCYFSLKAFLSSAYITPITKRLVMKPIKNILLLVLLTAVVISLLSVPNLQAKKRIDNRYPSKHLDSVSYFCGISLGQYLSNHGIGEKQKSVDSVRVLQGFMEYIACRTHMNNVQPRVHTFRELKDLVDDLENNTSNRSDISFQIGSTVARNLYANGYSPELKPILFVQGMCDYISGNQPKFSLTRYNDVLNKHKAIYDLHQEADNKKTATRFLEDNALNEGVYYMPSGLQYKVIKPGNSKRATSQSMVMFHYYEYTLGGDIVYSEPRNKYYSMNQLMPGLAEAISKIGEGGEIVAWIPCHLLLDKTKTPGRPGEIIVCNVSMESILF